MSDNIDVRVTAGLHPDNVTGADGYCEDTKDIFQPTRDAFQACYAAVGATMAAKEAASKNPAWTEAAQVIQVDDLAQKHFAKAAPKLDGARIRLEEGIAGIERDLTAPVASRGGSSIAAEVRAHAKGLSTSERMKLVRHAISTRDDLSASAVLGAPAFLSGLNEEMHGALTRMYHEARDPGASLRLRAMRGALAVLERGSPLFMKALYDATGCPPGKVQALRAAKTAAERHFVMNAA